MIKAVRGTRDLLPPETALWNFVESAVRDVFRAYHFQEIRTPIFEETALFSRSVGEETDIVGKEMYTWQDRGRAESDKGQSLTLRPENTAGVVRAYIEHKLWDRGLNKLYYIGPQFRRERPQKGRYRQFYQIGAEVLGPPSAGSESPARDAELLEMLATLLDRLGITGWNLELNSVGCPNDRAKFNQALRKALEPVVGKMCADCQRRAVSNPLRVFDCKVPEDQPIIEKLPRISRFLDEPCRAHFAAVQTILRTVGVPFTLNDRLVRGLDYYTRTAFEFTHGALGAQNAILGGGRYDGLVARFRGEAVPATGFSIGVSRLAAALAHIGTTDAKPEPGPVVVTVFDKERIADYQRMVHKLRDAGIRAELYLGSGKMGPQLKYADKRAAPCVVIQGAEEKDRGEVQIKDLVEGAKAAAAIASHQEWRESRPAQFAVPEDKLIDAVREVLQRHGVA